VILVCEDNPREDGLIEWKMEDVIASGYRLEYARTTTAAEAFIKERGDEIAAIILDGKMPPEMTPFATERLLPLIGGGVPIIGNSDSRDTQAEMEETGRFFYICKNKTENLDKVLWPEIFPLRE
jgi:hypothetical protein